MAGQKKHVIEEMKQERFVYEKLEEELASLKPAARNDVIPQYHGWSDHWGVPILCLSLEGPTLEDIEVEKASRTLRLSALEAIQCLSRAGLIHGDLELRNFVQSRADPSKALVIDFGRSFFTDDQYMLDAQVDEAKELLFLDSVDLSNDKG